MELLHGAALIIFYLYYNYSHRITNGITGFIILILISFIVLQNEQMKELTNSTALLISKQEKTDSEIKLINTSMKQQEGYIKELNTNIATMSSRQEKTDSELKLIKTSMKQQEGYIKQLNTNIATMSSRQEKTDSELKLIKSSMIQQDGYIKQLNKNIATMNSKQEKTDSELKLIKTSMIKHEAYIKELITKITIMISRQEKTDSELKLHQKTIESLQSNTQSQQVGQRNINNRFQNKILENERKLDTADETVKAVMKDMKTIKNIFGEVEKVYHVIDKMNKKVDMVADEMNKTIVKFEENVKELRNQTSSYMSKTESLQSQINKYEESESDRHGREPSYQTNQEYRSYQPAEHSVIPDIEKLITKGIKTVVSYGATLVYNAARTVYSAISSIGSYVGGLLW